MQNTRANWEATTNSSLGSEHLTADCFGADSALASIFDISKRRRSKPGATPTLFKSPETATRKIRAVSTSEGYTRPEKDSVIKGHKSIHTQITILSVVQFPAKNPLT